MSVPASASILETFKSKLNNEWRHSPSCGLHKYCTHNSNFISTASLQQWMKNKEDNMSETNVERLLEKADVIRPNFAKTESILNGDNCCVLVFSILVMKDCGRLVLLFQSAGITDKRLEEPTYDQSKLRETLEKHGIANIHKIMEQFDREKRAFCPVSLSFRMDRDFHSGLILPFCDLRKVNEKGGTASVFQVAVQKEFVCDEIKKHLGNPFQFGQYGECYQLAVKSYSKSQKETYDSEVEAFKGLHDRPGMVRYFGCYSHQHGEDGEGLMYHIVLELGRMDLVEYFYEHHPPELPAEIVRYWKSMCKIAEAIRTVHQLAHGREIYYGWHGDVKPDNILLVRNEWKLADFGFAKFKRAEEVEGDPKVYLRGGTDTFGSPEFARAKLHDGQISSTQKIDTWSFGCVLSVAATWVISGAKGIEDFIRLRQEACRERKLDAFHDGKGVLPGIHHWHQHLKTVMRKSDIISAKILDLIEDQMLKEKPSDRLTSEDLCKKLGGIVANAESLLRSSQETRLKGEYEILQTPDDVKQALLSMEKARNSVKNGESEFHCHGRLETSTAEGVSPEGNALPTSLVSNGLQSIRSMKSRKTQGPLDGTSHRQEILEKELASGCFAVPTAKDEEDPSTLPANIAKGKQRMHPRADPSRPFSPQRFHSNNHLSCREAQTQEVEITDPNEGHDGSPPNIFLSPERGTTSSQPLAQVSPQITFQNPSQSSRQSALPSHPRPSPQPNSPKSSLHPRGSSRSSRSSLSSSPSHSTAISPSDPIRPQSPPHQHPVPLPTVIQTSQTASSISLQSPSLRTNSKIPLEKIWGAVKCEDENARTVCQVILAEYENAPRYTDENRRTPIMVAAQANNMDTVRLLLSHSPVLEQDVDGKTLLHHVVSRPSSRPETEDSLDLIRQILMHAGQTKANIVNMLDNNKKSPLFYCVMPNMLETAELLIDHGAWINPPRNSAGKDVLIEAVNLQKSAMITRLLTRRADFEWSRLPKYEDIPRRIRSQLENVKPRQKAKGQNKSNRGKIRIPFSRK